MICPDILELRVCYIYEQVHLTYKFADLMVFIRLPLEWGVSSDKEIKACTLWKQEYMNMQFLDLAHEGMTTT